VIPSGSVAHFWKSVFGLNGLINGAFFYADPVNWLDTGWCRALITLVFIWKNAGYNIVLFLAGLHAIPQDYYEYAAVEGAGALSKFFRITLVYITPTAFLVFIMSIINSFKSFKEIYLICGAYPHSSIYMLQHYMNNQFAAVNYQKLASASYVLSLFIVALVLFIYHLQNKRAENL
jgi:multiple sugar transport system permease protein